MDSILTICEKYLIENYHINDDGTIDVFGNVNISRMDLTKLPLRFNKVSGHFNCMSNYLTSLEGSPIWVGDYFSCSTNKLTSLEGCPKYVGGKFYCYNNKNLTTNYCESNIIGQFHTSFKEDGLIFTDSDVAINYKQWQLKTKRIKNINFINEKIDNSISDTNN